MNEIMARGRGSVRQTVIRYGALLGISLVLLAVGRRAQLVQNLPIELYVGLVAFGFLAAGIAGAIIYFKLGREDAPRRSEILDPSGFSPRELDVLTFLVHGYTNREIAAHLKITQNTVKSHLKNIYDKLGVNNRTQAAAEAKLLRIVGED